MAQPDGVVLPVEIGVQDPWFKAIATGVKTVEGRLHKGKFAGIRAGHVLTVRRPGRGKSGVVVVVVTKVVRYASFQDYLACEGLNRTLPGVRNLSEGVSVYRAFYTEEDERKYGVVAIHVALL